MSNKKWFITGASGGFGRELAVAALKRGDTVAGAARNIEKMRGLTEEFGDLFCPVQLDITNRKEAFAAVAASKEKLGCIDVLVNNAGYGVYGMIEELSEKEFRDQMETNLFGTFNVTQAILPVFRQQKSGHILQMSSFAGITADEKLHGAYSASKWAIEGLSEVLAAEVSRFGIQVTLVEPSIFGTGFNDSVHYAAKPLDIYKDDYTEYRENMRLFQGGSPSALAQALLEVVDMPEPPLRILLGKDSVKRVQKVYQKRLANWIRFEALSNEAEGPSRA